VQAVAMEQIVSRENMARAYKRVIKNGGTSGVDGIEVDQLKGYLNAHWSRIKAGLLLSEYYPQAVKRVEIPKLGGGVRILGIPTVIDRMIQQAINQVLSPIYEPTFSEMSYGFRPGHKAQDAVIQARDHIRTGVRWVVDMDLSKFFDEVPHERLLSKLRKKISDKRVIHLIDRYLRAGMLSDGLEEKRSKGTPQGSPLSPLLSNIVLDELDKELEKRGHKFVRYADDFQIYVGSERTAKRVMLSLTNFIERKLRLKVNKEKSAIDRPWKRQFLGYSFTMDKQTRIKVSKKSLKRLKSKVKEKMRKGRGRNLKKFISKSLNPLLRGWMIYFSASETKGFTKGLDSWVRRHLRKIKWRQWKRPWTRKEKLIRRGLKEEQAVMSSFNQRGAWWNAGASHMNLAFPKSYFDKLDLVSLVQTHRKYHLTFNFENRRDT
jgi:RNA-directed DNA polymerase